MTSDPIRWKKLQRGLYHGTRRGSAATDTPWLAFSIDERLGCWAVIVGERGEAPNRKIGEAKKLAIAKAMAAQYAATGKVLKVQPAAKESARPTAEQHRRMEAAAEKAGAAGATQAEALKLAKSAAGIERFAKAGQATSRATAVRAHKRGSAAWKREQAERRRATARATKADAKAAKKAAGIAAHGGPEPPKPKGASPGYLTGPV